MHGSRSKKKNRNRKPKMVNMEYGDIVFDSDDDVHMSEAALDYIQNIYGDDFIDCDEDLIYVDMDFPSELLFPSSPTKVDRSSKKKNKKETPNSKSSTPPRRDFGSMQNNYSKFVKAQDPISRLTEFEETDMQPKTPLKPLLQTIPIDTLSIEEVKAEAHIDFCSILDKVLPPKLENTMKGYESSESSMDFEDEDEDNIIDDDFDEDILNDDDIIYDEDMMDEDDYEDFEMENKFMLDDGLVDSNKNIYDLLDMFVDDMTEGSCEAEEMFMEKLKGSFDQQAYLEKLAENEEKMKVLSSSYSSSDEETKADVPYRRVRLTKKMKKKMRRREKKTAAFDYHELCKWNTILRNIVKSRTYENIKVGGINKTQKHQIHLLANLYYLRIKSSQKAKMPLTVTTSPKSKMVSLELSKQYIKTKVCQQPQIETKPQKGPFRPKKKSTKYLADEEKLVYSSPVENTKKFLGGRVIGENAKPLSLECKGFVMLQKIGWQGGGLGVNKQGLQQAPEVRIKNNKTGLGY